MLPRTRGSERRPPNLHLGLPPIHCGLIANRTWSSRRRRSVCDLEAPESATKLSYITTIVGGSFLRACRNVKITGCGAPVTSARSSSLPGWGV